MVYMFVWGLRKYDYIISVDQCNCHLTQDSRNCIACWNVRGAIFGPMALDKTPLNKTEWSVEKRPSSFVATFISYFYLPVAAISVQCRENPGIVKRVDAFVLAQYGIRVPIDYRIHLVVIHAKVDCSIFC